jgi:hypothetical protein
MPQKAIPQSELRATLAALAAANGNESQAAKALGIPRGTLQGRLAAAARRGITADSVGEEGSAQYKMKLLEAQLRAAKTAELNQGMVRREIVKLADAVSSVAVPPWAAAAPKGKAGSPGVPTLFLSDLHWGEVVSPSQINGVNAYNVDIAKQRLHDTAETAVHLLRILSPTLDYPGIVVPLGGDMISGNIHDELAATNEFNTMPTILDLYGELCSLLSYMADTFGAVFVPCVSGNHGRDTKKIWNKDRHATSFDWLLYCLLAKHFEGDDRLTFLVPDSSDAHYRVYGHRYHLVHGDAYRGGDGLIGSLGPITRGDHKTRSRNNQIDLGYDTMLLGHFHQYMHLTRFIVNGSLKGYDEYAYNNSFGFEVPQQALWVTHPTHGITYRMPVKLAPERAADGKLPPWVEVKGGLVK